MLSLVARTTVAVRAFLALVGREATPTGVEVAATEYMFVGV